MDNTTGREAEVEVIRKEEEEQQQEQQQQQQQQVQLEEEQSEEQHHERDVEKVNMQSQIIQLEVVIAEQKETMKEMTEE